MVVVAYLGGLTPTVYRFTTTHASLSRRMGQDKGGATLSLAAVRGSTQGAPVAPLLEPTFQRCSR